MILPQAIQEFKERRLDDHDWIKSIERIDLEQYIYGMNPDPVFKTIPYKQQLASFILGTQWREFLFFLDAGTGKTKLSLDILMWRFLKGEWRQGLILVPNVQNFSTWERNVNLHSYLNICSLKGSSTERWQIWEDNPNADLYVINYAGLLAMLSDLEYMARRKKKRWVLNDEKINRLIARLDAVVFDEIHYCKNSSSSAFKMCNEIASMIPIRYGLTGTPFGRDPIDLWAQFYLIDRGVTLGGTIGLFRNAVLKEVSSTWKTRYALKVSDRKKVHDWLRNRSVAYAASECNDLPKCTSIPVPFTLTSIQRKYQRDIAKGMIKNAGTQIEISNSFVRLRQVTSGFIGIPGDEEGGRVELRLPGLNPKMEILEAYLDEFPLDDKVVISCEFVYSVESILAMLEERRKKLRATWTVGSLYGKTKDKSVWEEFQDNSFMKYFVIVSTSGGTGIDLFAANRMIFYETSIRPDVVHQTRKRIDRTGQTKKTFVYNFVGRGSVEEVVESYSEEGRNLMKELLESPQTVLSGLFK